MFIGKKRAWEIPEAQATSESVFLNRRRVLAGAGFIGGSALVSGMLFPPRASAAADDPSASLYPAPRNDAYKIEREITPEDINGTYNNFYEFGSHKRIYKAAQALPIRPWDVKIDGLVEAEKTIGRRAYRVASACTSGTPAKTSPTERA